MPAESNLFLNAIGGFLGGYMALTVIHPRGYADAGSRVTGSIAFAVLFTPIACYGLRLWEARLPQDSMLDLAVAGMFGLSGWFVLHPLLRWMSSLRRKSLAEFITEIASLTGGPIKGLWRRLFLSGKD